MLKIFSKLFGGNPRRPVITVFAGGAVITLDEFPIKIDMLKPGLVEIRLGKQKMISPGVWEPETKKD